MVRRYDDKDDEDNNEENLVASVLGKQKKP